METLDESYVVLKFGGTSLASAEFWPTIRDILRSRVRDGCRPVVVCSALAGVSDALFELTLNSARQAQLLDNIQRQHEELARKLEIPLESTLGDHFQDLVKRVLGWGRQADPPPEMQAEIIALGELFSSRLLCEWLSREGLRADWLDARALLTTRTGETDCPSQRFLAGTCGYDADSAIRDDLARRQASVLVTQGFIARDSLQRTVLLGRGGSDTAAAYLAAKLSAERLEIWTDVPGVFTANPHEVTDARLLRRVSYQEAEAFAAHGAKVLHPRCIQPMRESGIPVHVHSIRDPKIEGTCIETGARSAGVKGASVRRHLYLLTIQRRSSWQPVGFMADVASCFKRHGISIDLVSSSPDKIQATVDPAVSPGIDERVTRLSEDLAKHGRVSVRAGVSSVSLVGHDIRSCMYRFAPFMEILQSLELLMFAHGANDLTFTFVLPDSEATPLLERLHDVLFEESLLDQETFGSSWSELQRGDSPTTRGIGMATTKEAQPS